MTASRGGQHSVSEYELRPAELCSSERGPTAVDLFSGAGGLTLGLLNAGFKVLLASDISSACAATHRRNLPSIPFQQEDVRAISGRDLLRRLGLSRSELDVLVGGPPCQGFSIIGQRLLHDPRNALLREFVRIAGEIRPKVVVMENVHGLATLGKGILLNEIGSAFQELGYQAACAELLAAQYGVPQMRWRMFFIAWRTDFGARHAGFPWPTHGNSGIGDLVPNRTVTAAEEAGFLTLSDAIGDMPPVASGGECRTYEGPPRTNYQRAMRLYCGPLELHNHYAPRLSAINLRRIAALKPGEDWRDLPREMLPGGMQRALRKDHTRRFRRMTWDGVPRSIITRFRDPKSGEYIHPEQTRTISIREAARIQSFPDWFAFEGAYTDQYDQVGNAVPPLVAKAVGTEIRSALADMRSYAPVKSRYRLFA